MRNDVSLDKGKNPRKALPTGDRRPLATIEEVAEFLGVPVKTLYAWRSRRLNTEGPRGLRVGRHVRYRWSDVDAWVEAQVRSEDW